MYVEAGLHRLAAVLGLAVAAHRNEAEILVALAEPASYLVAIDAGEPDVHEGNVRLHRPHQLDASVSSLADTGRIAIWCAPPDGATRESRGGMSKSCAVDPLGADRPDRWKAPGLSSHKIS